MFDIDPKTKIEAEMMTDELKEQLEYDYKMVEASINLWKRERNKKLKKIKEDKRIIKKYVVIALICTVALGLLIYFDSDLNQGFKTVVVTMAIIGDIIGAVFVIPTLIRLNREQKELKGGN